MNFGILTLYLGKWFINLLENFFILWHILILPYFTPHQGQKTIFWWFEQCGISLDMFERVKWPVLWNLSLISIIMRIREKKIGTKYWNWPRCNQNSQILAKKSISQYGYLKHSKWAVLWNLSFISIIMRISEKKLGCLNTKNLWLATMLLFFICVFCSEVFWYYDTPIFFHRSSLLLI